MRYHEIIGETVATTSIASDTWETRFADHQRQQRTRMKARAKLADTESRAADQGRKAAATRARLNDKVAAARRALTRPETV